MIFSLSLFNLVTYAFADCFLQPQQHNDDNDNDVRWSKDEKEATPADGDHELSTCTERWKAAQSDSVKRVWAIYRETGIFISACRHGFIWWICDMVESGELCVLNSLRIVSITNDRATRSAKYPLALVNSTLR